MAITKVAFDTSYPTGGEALTAANLGLAGIEALMAFGSDGRVVEAILTDAQNALLKLFQGDNDNAADAPLIEVGNTSNQSAVDNVLVIAIGR